MSEHTLSEDAFLLLVIVWALGAMALVFAGFGFSESTPFLWTGAAWAAACFEWFILAFVGIARVEEAGDITQRPDETNLHHAARVWVGVHALLLAAPFVGLSRVPAAARRLRSWARATPEVPADE